MTTKTSTIDVVNTNNSGILEIYGQAIYDREKCASCHTLNMQNATDKLVSLDGLGKKFSAPWLYTYLLDPPSIIANSQKAGYAYLHAKPFDTLFLNHVSHMYKTGQTDKKLMVKLIDESKPISNELKKFGIENDQTEILALIAYLQQIPSSPEKKRRDSLENILWKAQAKVWDSIASNDYVLELGGIDLQESIANGKQIFSANCKVCHGQNGQGMVGPNLTDDYYLYGATMTDIVRNVAEGAQGKGMMPWRHTLSIKHIRDVANYVYSLKGTNHPQGKAPQGVKEK